MVSPTTLNKRHATRVVGQLRRDYPDAKCALNFQTPVQLLVATILSAQCTDERVNMVTSELFRRYPSALDLANATQRSLEQLIQSTGFFRNKARHLKACCQTLAREHNGEVPKDLNVLVQLAGVGRKTANVVLGTAYGMPSGIVVDTHVGRLSRRLGLTDETDPVKVERHLMDLLPKKEWIDYSHRMIYHGRAVCKARQPRCEACSLRRMCPRIGVATG